MARAKRGRASRKPMAVRIIPAGEGEREQKVERILASIKESMSTTRIQVKSNAYVNPGTSDSTGKFTYQNIRGTNDFSAMASIFTKYRVVCYRFDVYDINPNQTVVAYFGTYHGVGQPTTVTDMVDLPDSGIVPAGTGSKSWYWYPTGNLEKSWFDVGDIVTDFGGLAWYLFGTSGAPSKYNLVVSAVVDFRSRN